MTDPVTVELVNALVGQSQAALGGRIDTLAEAQRLAAETSSREHLQVRESIDVVAGKLEELDEKVGELAGRSERDAAADAVIAMWRRRFLAALVSAITLLAPLTAAALERWLSA